MLMNVRKSGITSSRAFMQFKRATRTDAVHFPPWDKCLKQGICNLLLEKVAHSFKKHSNKLVSAAHSWLFCAPCASLGGFDIFIGW